MKSQKSLFFCNFEKSASLAYDSARLLADILSNFNPADLPVSMRRMHEIEHAADEVKHEVTAELSRAFVTPIDRYDIAKLIENLDNVTDSIEEVLIRIHICSVKAIRPDVEPFTALLIRCCDNMHKLLGEFTRFKSSGTLKTYIIEINRLEEEGDRLYMHAMHRLHTDETDALHVLAWREVYSCFEVCFDACEHVADVVESIAIINT